MFCLENAGSAGELSRLVQVAAERSEDGHRRRRKPGMDTTRHSPPHINANDEFQRRAPKPTLPRP